jgi:hypothetical protein
MPVAETTPEEIAAWHLKSAHEAFEFAGVVSPYMKEQDIVGTDGTVIATIVKITGSDPRYQIGDVCQAMNAWCVGYLDLYSKRTIGWCVDRTVQDFGKFLEESKDGTGILIVKASGQRMLRTPCNREQVSSMLAFPFRYV